MNKSERWVKFQGNKIAHKPIYWERASVLTQIGFGLLIAGALFTLTACSSGLQKPTQETGSGFLSDYNSLQSVPNPPAGTQIYTYNAPGVKRSDYKAVILSPVQLYQTATKEGITPDAITAAQAQLQAGISKIVAQKIALTDTPGPGVATLSVAITGAQLQTEGLKPWNLIPISAAITLASSATGLNSKTPVLIVEMKFTDSVSGKLLREVMTIASGESFRNKVNTGAEFTALAQTWVQEALQYSSRAT